MVSKIVIISWLQNTVESSGSLVSLSLSASENETTRAQKVLNQIVQSNRIFKKEKNVRMFQRHKKQGHPQEVYRVF